MRLKFILLIILGFFLGGTQVRAADVFMGTSRVGSERIPLMILPLQGASVHSEALLLAETALNADLERSRLFRVVEPGTIGLSGAGGGAPEANVMRKASAAGIQALVWARLYASEDDWVLESYAYETAKGEQVIGVKIIGSRESIRALAHRFSDKVVQYFTGEKGIAETKVTFISDLSGKKEVYIMDYDGRNPRRITTDRSIAISPRWSFNGKKITYTSYRSGNPDIYLLDLTSGFRKSLVSFPGLNFSTSWSPLGDRIAFASTKDGNAEIYTMNTDGTGHKRLTFNAADDLSPSWSPTGKQIAFTSDRGGGPQIYIMDDNGMNVRRLTFIGKYNTSPTWSPKGDWIAYTCRDEEKRLKLCADRADGQQSIRITESGPWDDESPSWALNGRDLVFTSSRSGKNQIYSIHLDGTRLIRLTSSPANNTSPSWSPN
ncbi:MAG: Tol-Pal system beta propeller repeat protein TolB [Nitrospiria bacterium]